MAASPQPDDELVRRALDGLFEIACEDRPASVRRSIQRQIEDMPARECRKLVEEMVDTDRLATLIRQEASKRPTRPPRAPEPGAQKVDEALEPLVALTCGEDAAKSLHSMEEDERLHLLFSSLGSR